MSSSKKGGGTDGKTGASSFAEQLLGMGAPGPAMALAREMFQADPGFAGSAYLGRQRLSDAFADPTGEFTRLDLPNVTRVSPGPSRMRAGSLTSGVDKMRTEFADTVRRNRFNRQEMQKDSELAREIEKRNMISKLNTVRGIFGDMMNQTSSSRRDNWVMQGGDYINKPIQQTESKNILEDLLPYILR